MNFVFNQMTALRYFIPLIIEGNKRSIQSFFFIKECGKYNCVYTHLESLIEIAKKYNIRIHSLAEIDNFLLPEEPLFFIEDHCLYECASIANKKYVITSMTDFVATYNKPDDDIRPGVYINYCDHVFMPSEFFAEYYDTLSSKNIYLGSPKYDVEFDREEIHEKYDLKRKEKKALVILPRMRDIYAIDLNRFYRPLRAMGYKILAKTRGKDSVEGRFKGNYFFEDKSWFPHTTMELIAVSDIVINFGSTSVKECVMLKKPLINVDTKPFDIRLDFLYDYPYCAQMDPDFTTEELQNAVKNLTEGEYNTYFDEAIREHLFEKGNVSKNILDYLRLKK